METTSFIRRSSRRATALAAGCLVVIAAVGGHVPARADTGSTAGATVGVSVDVLGGGLDATLSSTLGTDSSRAGWSGDTTQTPLDDVRRAIGADKMWNRGWTGRGVGVALLDTGVVPVPGLTSGNVVNGPDLSFESQVPQVRYLDTFGHGTHMAGIIAGRDEETRRGGGRDRFLGVAPDARLTSLKLATSHGAVDVSQVIAGIDWVVQHRNDDPRTPIRVLNLSYGTDGVQDYQVDPLTHAVENAWRAGIVVVTSGGNDGTSRDRLNDPAYDPRVIAVGASDIAGTPNKSKDDTVPAFSSRGSADRRVDVVAPGRSVLSLRNPGSYADETYPSARVDDRFFKGTGTSEAAAVVSGAVALLLEQRPDLTPDQVKALLRSTADTLPGADAAGQGAGEIDLAAAMKARTPVVPAVTAAPSRGTGSLEAARGTQHVADGDTELTGENDIFGPWDAETWAAASSAGTSWSGGLWNGAAWTGDCWCATSWSGRSWDGRSWDGRSWDGRSWDGRSWDGRSWDGRSWDGWGS